MNLVPPVRTWAPAIMLGVVGCVFGCSNGPASTPVDKETEKKIFVDTRAARKEIKEDQAQPKVRGNMKEGHRREGS